MRLLIIISLIVQFTWTLEESNRELTGWLEKVGTKNAEAIKQSEDQLYKSRIVGGALAPVYGHPYLAGLLIDVIGLSAPAVCGGSILSSTRILTAAHCWFDGKNQAYRITTVLGSPFIFHGGLRILPTHISLHPHYDFRTFANDIAMLYLPVHIPFSQAIQPISLPTGDLLQHNLDGQWVRAAGYGRYSDSTTPTLNTMARNVWLQVKPVQACRGYYGDLVQKSNICTNGIGGVGICQGDSGGPLTVNVNGTDILVGVSSFVALDGCELGYPSAFARVSSYLDWIYRVL